MKKRQSTLPSNNLSWGKKGLWIAGSFFFVVLGFFLVETHQSLWHTLTGFVLWGFAVRWIMKLVPEGPGIPVFSGTTLLQLTGGKDWGFLWSTLAGAAVLAAVKMSDLSLQREWWALLALSLIALGGLLTLLEKKSPAFWTEPSDPPLESPIRWWPEVLVLILGVFFLFYRLDQWPDRAGGECLNTLLLGRDFMTGKATTPYYVELDSYRWFPGLLLGLAFKVIGFSFLKGSIVFAVINLAGFLFFYEFLKFYLTRYSALATALLYASSHWVAFMARQTFEGASIIVALETAALYFFARAVEKGKRRDFVSFGVLMACILCTYLSCRFVFVFFLAATLVIWVFRFKDIRAQKAEWVLGWGVFLLFYFPMILFYLHTENPFIGTGFSKRISDVNILSTCSRLGSWQPLWDNLQEGLRMFTVMTTDTWTSWFPFLSPWEGFCLLAGFGWCLWRFFKPAFLILFLGFFGGMCNSVLTNIPTHSNRVLADAPYVYLLVGIGLDRLGRAVAAPLGKGGRFLGLLFGTGVLVLSVSWQYDIYFRQMPKSFLAWVGGGGQFFLAGNTLAPYPKGWDIYVPVHTGFPYEIFSDSPGASSDVKVFFPQSGLPFKNVPEKGVVLLLPEEMGRILENWISFYYPESKPRLVKNRFGGIPFMVWEISPPQLQKGRALQGKSPPGGIQLSWYDSSNRKLGQWLVPTLAPDIQIWFDALPNEQVFPAEKVAYFVAKGWIRDPEKAPLALQSTSDADWTVGQRILHLKGEPLQRHSLELDSKNWVPLKIRAQHIASDSTLGLYRLNYDGWDFVPSNDLRP